jgi:hypothetical protein
MAINNYPAIQKWEPRDQLLFDFGYSYALIMRVTAVLKEIAECDDYPVEVKEMIEAIEDFQEHRLKLRNTIYDNAEAALDLDKRLAAFEKILDEADYGYDDAPEDLKKALDEAQRLTGRRT